MVTKVPPYLAGDGWYRKGQETPPAGRLKPVHRVDQTHRGDLDEVLQRLTPVSEATGEVLGQRKIARDQLIAKPLALGIFTSQIRISLVQPNQMRILTALTVG
jgi:hypothetical protein